MNHGGHGGIKTFRCRVHATRGRGREGARLSVDRFMTGGEGYAPAWQDGAVVFQHQGGTRRRRPPLTLFIIVQRRSRRVFVLPRSTEVQASFCTAFGSVKGRAAFVRVETRRRRLLYPVPTEGNAHSTLQNNNPLSHKPRTRTRKPDEGGK